MTDQSVGLRSLFAARRDNEFGVTTSSAWVPHRFMRFRDRSRELRDNGSEAYRVMGKVTNFSES